MTCTLPDGLPSQSVGTLPKLVFIADDRNDTIVRFKLIQSKKWLLNKGGHLRETPGELLLVERGALTSH